MAITANKAKDAVAAEKAAKRGGGKVRGESVFLQADDSYAGLSQALSSEHAPDVAAELSENLNELLRQLSEPPLQEIALFKLEGFSNQEIAKKIGRSVATVERRLKRIRQKWRNRLEDRDS